MSSADRTEAYLRSILDRVDGWLRFAEVKNGGVIALSATVTTALLTALRNMADLTLVDQVLFTGAMAFFLLALAAGLYSYLPRTRPDRERPDRRGTPADSDNLFFYGDLGKYDGAALAAAVARRYAGDADYDPAAHPVHLDLATQIAVNSRITLRKLRLFERGGGLALVGSVLYATALVVRLIGY